MRRLGLLLTLLAAALPALAGDKTAPELLREGGRLFARERFEQALEPLRAALQVDPGLTQARRLLGESLAALDRCEEALVHIEQALEEAPRHSDNARTMTVLAECDRRLREARPAVPPAPAAPAPAASEPAATGAPAATDWQRPPDEQTVVYEAPEEPDVAAELEAGGMESNDSGDQLHWAGAAAGATGLVLIVIAAALVEDYNDHRYDQTTNRCVSPDGKLDTGACPDNTWSYALWGVGGALVIGGGLMLLLHDWGDGDDEAADADAGQVRAQGGVSRRGGWVGVSGRF